MTDGPETSAELLVREEGDHVLDRRPAIDRIPPRMLALLEAKSPNLTHAERGQALELAVAYQLDPFANEIWFAKGRGRDGAPGRLLIMVGRDGLRKIAQRNGLELIGDVVRHQDEFVVTYLETAADAEAIGLSAENWRQRGGGYPFHHVVHRQVGLGSMRGELRGSWARVYERATGIERGWFVAPIEEYKPDSDKQSPWQKQTSVMILAAAERQAVRQATPLGGLLVEGEDVLINENGAAQLTDRERPFEGYPREGQIEDTIERARRLGHVQLSDIATVQMVLGGQDEEFVLDWLEVANGELAGMETEPQDAEVVPERIEDVIQDDAADEIGDEVFGKETPEADTNDNAAAMRSRAKQLRDAAERANAEGDADLAGELEAEADALEAEASAAEDANQGQLEVD